METFWEASLVDVGCPNAGSVCTAALRSVHILSSPYRVAEFSGGGIVRAYLYTYCAKIAYEYVRRVQGCRSIYPLLKNN